MNRSKLILGVIMILGAITLGFWQWNELQANQVAADAYSNEAANLTAIKNELIDEYQSIKAEVLPERESAQQETALVFPNEEELTGLTRLLDDFAVKNNFDSNPFFISNIGYSSVQEAEGEDYRYVPVNLSLTTSKKNLKKFLEFIHASGSLESETRLMSVEDMTLGYPDEYGGTHNVRLLIYAYFSREL